MVPSFTIDHTEKEMDIAPINHKGHSGDHRMSCMYLRTFRTRHRLAAIIADRYARFRVNRQEDLYGRLGTGRRRFGD